MHIITLTTDFGYKDPYVGALKGAIYSQLEDVRIVDISHEVSPFHLAEAAYIIKNAYQNFPKKSIHIIGVDSELTPENKHLVVLLNGHYFICADNGILSMLILEQRAEKIVEINIHDRIISNSSILDAFINVACHIARGGTLEVIGKPIHEIKELTGMRPTTIAEKNQIKGNVQYIDNYGNVITNVTKKLFEDFGKGRDFEILARSEIFKEVYKSYGDAISFDIPFAKRTMDGKKIALWNTSKHLELAIYKSNQHTFGSASSLFGLEYRDTITITFK
ncbi:MAG TPA: SAM-dependent chlorinase/fluorinase [Flavobacteriaceae bacterium]|nr:SAM-dependent chlorinase/fluorinase [Flavobacteriaceae bacterium]